jgi:hypothetical protein
VDETQEETMKTNVIIDAPTGEVERELLLWLARRNARAIEARTLEDAAIEAEDVLSQADEALVMG